METINKSNFSNLQINSQSKANQGDIMEKNIIELLCGALSFEEVLTNENRTYKYKTLIMSPIDGNYLLN
jgi:hypothetical protein